MLIKKVNEEARHPWLAANAVFYKESVIKTLPKIASKFLFKSLRCKLSYQLPILISLRMGIKSQIEN